MTMGEQNFARGFNEEKVKQEILAEYPKLSPHVLKNEVDIRRRQYMNQRKEEQKVSIVLKIMAVVWVLLIVFVAGYIFHSIRNSSISVNSATNAYPRSPATSSAQTSFFSSHSEL
eukprot:TRINITY_DN37327_c0_g1_i1.p1 TRINITY_DN37327_c0_g1~~TRINITY_DN37327_c0_g1_i1.p1  ORF type:complete len:115 (+),score=25.94 TRINITY_DN37327_c0_g1_i1:65-409(+)